MPLEKSQERPSLSENTERSHKPGLCLTDELELRFLENLREHGRTEDTISVYRRNLSKLRKSLPEDSNLTPAPSTVFWSLPGGGNSKRGSSP